MVTAAPVLARDGVGSHPPRCRGDTRGRAPHCCGDTRGRAEEGRASRGSSLEKLITKWRVVDTWEREEGP